MIRSQCQQIYTFKERVGTGKFSVVFRSESKRGDGHQYAIKVIEKNILDKEEFELIQ